MKSTYLFDWGDTLMVDFPQYHGKMCSWPEVKAVDGAKQTLIHLSKSNQIYIATGAADSSEQEIKAAFQRVGLSSYIDGYFCQQNLGIGKDSPDFFKAIMKKLQASPSLLTMVGDTYEKDIRPASKLGIRAIWLTDTDVVASNDKDLIITHLTELIDII